MRMHEILGVEPGEIVTYVNDKKQWWHEFYVDNEGVIRIAHCDYILDSSRAADIINNPDRIIRKPRLTGEQIEHLKALNLLGYKYLYLSHCGYCYASTTEPILTGTTAELPSNRTLNDLLKTVKIPLDILQVLKDAGVEV